MLKNHKTTLIGLAVVGLVVFSIFLFQPAETAENSLETDNDSENIASNEDLEISIHDFIDCLIDKGVAVYASKTCPACTSLANQFGGYDNVDDLFVFCSEERDKCIEDMKTNFVPEIQIGGELYEGARNLQSLSEKVSCKL